MKFKITHITIVLFLSMFFVGNAQNKQLRAFTLEDGLPQSQVYAMTQDSKGYLWLGTQGGGLARFDGNDFRVFNEANGLLSNYINALLTQNNTLYIGTKRGLSIKHKSKFTNIETPEINKISLIKNDLFVLTHQGIYKVKENKTVEKIKVHPEIDILQIKDMMFFDGYYWIATQEGLWQLNELSASASTFEKLERNDFAALAGFDHKVFASTFNDGTLVFDSKNVDDVVLIREPLRINDTAILNTDELWIATDNDGISVIDTSTNSELFTLTGINGLSVPNVKQVLQDRQSNIWIATSGGGLYKYFQNNFKHFNTDTGLNGNRVYAVHHKNNAIWISTSEKGLMRIDDFGIHDVDIPEAFSQVKIKTITSDLNGNIWAGSEGRGLLFHGKVISDSIIPDSLKIRKKAFPRTIEVNRVLSTENGFPLDDWIRKIHIDKNTIYAATYSSGIVKFRYDAQRDSLTVLKVFGTQDGIQDLYIKDMVKGDNGQLWYATRNGELGYIQNNKVTHLGAVLDLKTPINSILFHNKTLFLGTAGKGIWWSNDDTFSTFKKLKGAKKGSSENIYQLIFDNQGYLWAGTERGVDKLELDKDNEIKDAFFFGRNDGFLGIETCLNAVDKDANGHLWFGALYGLTEYRPTETDQETKKPKLFLEDVKVANKSVDSIQLISWTNTDKVLKLNPDQRQVSFSFKTVDIDHPNGVEYRYKLNDNDWSPWSSKETQDFSELNFGTHDFLVQSRNHRWKESEPLRFSFYIESPLLKKAWFQWTILGLAILGLAAIAHQYIKRIKRRTTKEKERLELENHLLTLEQKALRLQMNPHFIFNVLNGIKAMAPTKPDKMNETVNSFATLLRETLVNSRKDTISLDQEIKTLKHYVEVERLMAEKQFDYAIELNTDLDAEEILIPPMLIQPFVENAIRHGILKGSRAGKLRIQFDTTDNLLKVSITDNGIGIYSSQQQKPKTDHQSMALTVTRERLESISGKNALEISEIKNSDGSIGGTAIVFTIPLETDY
ncbi:two-component regulator propeller domain-containing protein [uncultured Psychroserpens sp.]|uniref:ligand-binding sensor domain-containing protein n=1 Tax=uncultured Psychroserpens sp. TaxID=255436 RepID=UPI0026139FD6|nr:two-component regulator propeller domain-containing protein [uncultured Psychroserpens sp.]